MSTTTSPALWQRVLLALLATLWVSWASAARAAGDPVAAAQVLVKLRADADLPGLLQRHQLTLQARFGTRPIYRLGLIGSTDLAGKLAALNGDATVLLAEANAEHSSPEGRKNLIWAIGSAAQYSSQWAPGALRLAQAHTLSTGANVRVAVLDTGIDASHPLLAGRLLPGHDFVDGDTDPSEQGQPSDAGFGHGTHVAGIVALVAPGARIMPLRVLDAQGKGNAWVLGEALLHALDPDGNPATADGAHVINLSLGSLNRTELFDALAALASCGFVLDPAPADDFTDPGYNGDRERCANGAGAVLVVAAGNGASKSERQYPAAEGAYGLIPVAATQSDNRLAAFSNFGSWIELAAPGDGITSALPGGAYGTWSGTSMAAPMVAGVAALLRAQQPGLSAKDLARRIERNSPPLCNAKQLRLDAATALGLPAPPAPQCR